MSLHNVIWCVALWVQASSLGKFIPISDMSSHSIYEHPSDYEKIHVLFPQDGTTAHKQTYALFKVALAAARLWPSRPPDIRPCDFYFTVYYRTIYVLIIIAMETS